MTRPLARALLVAVSGLLATGAAQSTPGDVVLVLPFENTQRAERLNWLREGATLLLSRALDTGRDAAVRREERLHAFDRLHLPAGATLSRASQIRVAQLVGASAVVVGRFEVSGGKMIVAARLVRIDAGQLLPEMTTSGPPAELFDIFSRLAAAITGRAKPEVDQWPPSTSAFESYVRGVVAESPAAGARFLEQALTAAPRYDDARRALWQAYSDMGEHQRALAVVTGGRPGGPATTEARFLGALSLLSLARFDEALETLNALLAESREASVLNAIGVAELRRSTVPQPGHATYYFSQATQVDPADGDLFFNLGYAYWLDRDPRAAAYWLREAVRRNPRDGDAHFLLGAALHETNAAEAARERDLASRLSSTHDGWEAPVAAAGPVVPRGIERLHTEMRRGPSAADALVTVPESGDPLAAARRHLEIGRQAFDRQADRDAVESLQRALFLSPYLAEAHLLRGRVDLRAGRTEEAIEALKIAVWSEESVAAHVALGEAYLQLPDIAAARAELERALALDPTSDAAHRLEEKLGRAP